MNPEMHQIKVLTRRIGEDVALPHLHVVEAMLHDKPLGTLEEQRIDVYA
jgi:hypothetical protein